MSTLARDALAWLGTPDRAPRVVAGLAVALFVSQVASVALLENVAAFAEVPILAGFGLHALFVLGIVVGADRLRRGSYSPARLPRLLGWYLGGALAVGAINLLLMGAFPAETAAQNAGWLAFAGSMGAGAGLVVGLVEARAIDRAVAAERDAAEADLLADQRDRFEYMNALLRHEVLNNAQVIQGNAEYVRARVDDPDVEDRLAVISRKSEDMAAVVEDVRLVSEGLGTTDLEPVDLAGVLRAELRDVADAHEAVETDLDCPESVDVLADDLLARVFGNLFDNAVEHNDGDRARIVVEVAVDPETVTVSVADDGPGVADEVRDTLFDRSAGPHGVGLYLVATLVRHYGGTVELAETGPDGSVFAVELRRPEAGGARGRPASTIEEDVAGAGGTAEGAPDAAGTEAGTPGAAGAGDGASVGADDGHESVVGDETD